MPATPRLVGMPSWQAAPLRAAPGVDFWLCILGRTVNVATSPFLAMGHRAPTPPQAKGRAVIMGSHELSGAGVSHLGLSWLSHTHPHAPCTHCGTRARHHHQSHGGAGACPAFTQRPNDGSKRCPTCNKALLVRHLPFHIIHSQQESATAPDSCARQCGARCITRRLDAAVALQRTRWEWRAPGLAPGSGHMHRWVPWQGMKHEDPRGAAGACGTPLRFPTLLLAQHVARVALLSMVGCLPLPSVTAECTRQPG